MLGRSLLAAGKPDEAIEPLETAVALDERNPDWKRMLANALTAAARTVEGHWSRVRYYERAEKVAGELVKDSPTYSHLLLLGQAQLGAERYKRAASTVRRAISLDRDDWRAYCFLAQTFSHRRRYRKAEPPLRSALQLASGGDRTLVLNWLGWVLWGQGRHAEAAEAYHAAGNPEAAKQVREAQRRAKEQVEDFEALVEAIRKGGPPKWLPGDPIQVPDAAGIR